MRIKKFVSAVLAASMTASALLTPSAFQTYAADKTLTFDIRTQESNEFSVSTTELAAGDVTVPVSIYIPENPGVSAISLKLQVNDGQEAEDGTLGNYGLYFSDGTFADPYCFDSASEGDSSKAFSTLFVASKMNMSWIYKQQADADADAAAEAGTFAWDSSASWAYKNAFVNATLVIPQNTPAGEYKLDVRTEKYVNALSGGEGGTVRYGQSACKSAGSDEALAFKSIPLTISVFEDGTSGSDSETISTSTTTSTSKPKTSTTTTSTSKPKTSTTTTSTSKPKTSTTTTSTSKPKTSTTTTSTSKPKTSTTTTSTSKPKTSTTTTSTSKPKTNTTTTVETTSGAPISTTKETTTVETTSGAPISTTKETTTVETTSGAPISTTKETTTVETTSSAPVSSTSETTTETTSWVITNTTESTSVSFETTTTTTSICDTSFPYTDTTVSTGDGKWRKNYSSASTGHYVIFGDVAGAPGEEVEVPLYVFGDVGTAGLSICIGYDQVLKLTDLTEAPTVKESAYLGQYMINPDIYPATVIVVDSKDTIANDGTIVLVATFEIPADAKPGDSYTIRFEDCTEADESGMIPKNQIVNHNGDNLDVKMITGSITVINPNEVTLNKSSHNFSGIGETLSLNLFNADGAVTWKSSDDKVATVDENGFVTSVGTGSAVITATCAGKDYTCSVMVGLFGDVDSNGDVSLVDALTVLQAYTTNTLYHQPMPLTDEECAIADVDGDGKISLTDALCILQYYTRTTLYGEQNVSWYEITNNPNAPGAP